MEDACRAGGASLFVSGIDPGFINDVVPLLQAGSPGDRGDPRVRDLQLRALRAARRGPLPRRVRAAARLRCRRWWRRAMPTMVWGGQIRLIARGLGLALDEIREVVERRPLARDVTNRLGDLRRGHPGRPSLRGAGLDRRPAADHRSSTSPASPTTSRPTGRTAEKGGARRADRRTPVAAAHDRGRGRATATAPAAATRRPRRASCTAIRSCARRRRGCSTRSTVPLPVGRGLLKV